MFLERVSFALVFFRLFGLSGDGALHPGAFGLEPEEAFWGRRGAMDYRCRMDYLFLLCASRSGNRSFYAGLGDRVGDVYHQLRDNYGRCFPGIHLYRAGKGSASGDGDVEAELWRLSDAHILAWSVGRHL